MSRAVRQKVKLVSSGGTGHFYTTTVNKKTATAKLSRRKYDPRLRRHVRYDEAKI